MDVPSTKPLWVRAGAATASSALFAATLGVAGCAGGSGSLRAGTQTVSPSDFRDAGEVQADAPSIEVSPTPADSPRVISAREARGGDPDVLTLVGRPANIDAQIRRPSPTVPIGSDSSADSGSVAAGPGVAEEGIVVDKMVGQINGRPVYAAQFLSSLDDLLRAEAIEKSREEWVSLAGRLIQNQLLERVRDELLIAEFNAGLTFEERVGLFAFIDQIQQGIIDRDLGSAARADERLRDQENVSLRGKAEEEFNREIVFEQLRREVTRKVQVSWRDIQRYYDQNITVFQPPSTARLRVLRVAPADRDRLTLALADEPARSQIISSETTFRSSEGGLIELELGSDGLEAAEFFGPPELNDPATQLRPGELSAPIEFNGSIWWLYLEAVVQPEAVSLYDAQNRIEQAIRAEREQAERARYFERLFGSSTMTEQQLGEMRDRLIDFAIDRYLGDGTTDG